MPPLSNQQKDRQADPYFIFAWIVLFLILSISIYFFNPPQESLGGFSFEKAVQDAINNRDNPEVVLTNLIPENEFLEWDSGKVKMVTWIPNSAVEYYNVGKFTKVRNFDMWLTAVPELRKKCEQWKLCDEPLTNRIEQLLGLPATASNNFFVEVWVDPNTVQRPAANPDVTKYDSIRFPEGSDEFKFWFLNNFNSSFDSTSFPWLRLGYTYDWSREGKVGLSEFVVIDKDQPDSVKVAAIYSTDSYCNCN